MVGRSKNLKQSGASCWRMNSGRYFLSLVLAALANWWTSLPASRNAPTP